MSAVVIDTHAIVWYFLKSENLSATALAAIDRTEGGRVLGLLGIDERAIALQQPFCKQLEQVGKK